MKKGIYAALVVMSVAFVSCSKDDDNTPPPVEPPTAVELMTKQTWNIDTIGFDADKNGVIDMAVLGGLKACQKDNTISFSADSTGVFSEGATKCDAGAPSTTPFTWMLKNNDKVLNIEGNLENLQGDIAILELTDSTLMISKEINITFPSPTTANLIVSLTK